jgi:lipopolysaccharide export system protein LptA
MKFPVSCCLLIMALCGVAGLAHAEKADRNKPMNIEADALRHEDQKQTSVFTGRVVVTKGSIVIRGARVEVRQDAEGNQYGLVTAEPGKLAFYRQKRDGVDEFIEGEAETIEYDSRADTVKFLRRAQMRRYRGATLNDEITGSTILFDNTTEVFSVDGGAAQGTPGAPAPRVRAMLMPKPEDTGAAAAASKPGTPKPALRPSTGLGEGQK